ncbi:MAG: hypothetical protein LBF44_03010 [Holosporaceae bacterium]|jgi:hypothetical protein|nr:hypothetical protein [Holosporaceae bacterium]
MRQITFLFLLYCGVSEAMYPDIPDLPDSIMGVANSLIERLMDIDRQKVKEIVIGEIEKISILQRRETIGDVLQRAKLIHLPQECTDPLQAYLDATTPPKYFPKRILEYTLRPPKRQFCDYSIYEEDPVTLSRTPIETKSCILYSIISYEVASFNQGVEAQNKELETAYRLRILEVPFPVDALVRIVFASFGRIDTEFMPRRISETVESISGLNSPQEQHDSVSKIYKRLATFSSVLDVDGGKLREVAGYVHGTREEMPTTELGYLINRFNHLFTLRIE